MTTIKEVLKVFSDRVSVCTDMDWIIVGSTASLIQGCNNIRPNDIDILVKQNGDVDKIVNLFMDYLPKITPSLIFNKHWVSTMHAPTFSIHNVTKKWSFARLNIHGIIIEIANTVPDEYLELSPIVWELKKYDEYEEMFVPVVPLELQMHSSYEQKKLDRVRTIKEIIKSKNLDLQFMENYLSSSDYRQLMEEI
ncbi:MAG TPA: hypothetical protein DEF35_28950 [Paenibacillus sp.]|uniref:hypothetical protein n=1 Tax=Paenibacillus TaxID=44249 RepID=UPI000B9FE377|nr:MULTISPECIES: hypothetical protein [Paenibacillus]OZQ59755.1 hypothetical protein CA599_31015 [Paenibacillus taichungensis]HBU85642.1 hypothetical protein [Paenibacillus sp.]